eukprot:824207-Alexandrium_andersonii.AAC.1
MLALWSFCACFRSRSFVRSCNRKESSMPLSKHIKQSADTPSNTQTCRTLDEIFGASPDSSLVGLLGPASQKVWGSTRNPAGQR